MTKENLQKENTELRNEILRLKHLLPGVKTDEYIKRTRKNKESFKFTYTIPALDWFETVDVEIKPDDYYYFKIEKRFGGSWWLIGTNTYDTPNYHWEDKTIGEIDDETLKRFIEWSKFDDNIGCAITQISVISGSMNIFDQVKYLIGGK